MRGAFTGADSRGTEGAIQKADGSTLFIDELCSLDRDIQRKLLRAVEEKSYKALGAETYRTSDFRLITAAQPRIYDLVRSAQFREDLLSRVEVVTIKLPPLRERREDILALASHFHKLTREELAASDLPCTVEDFTKSALRAFREYPWPRNVRELRHAVHNGIVQAQLRGSRSVDIIDVAPRLVDHRSRPTQKTGSTLPTGHTLKDAVEKLEYSMITDSLNRNDNMLSAVCQELGMGRTTLWRKIKQYDIFVQEEMPVE